jgi:hypothetical protein
MLVPVRFAKIWENRNTRETDSGAQTQHILFLTVFSALKLISKDFIWSNQWSLASIYSGELYSTVFTGTVIGSDKVLLRFCSI